MASKIHPLLMVPQDIMNECAERSRRLRLQQNITQQELAERVGVAVGTIKRFEKTGEAQFRTVLNIALVLRKLEDFTALFSIPDGPTSLYHPEPKKPRQRARKKKNAPPVNPGENGFCYPLIISE